MTSTVIITTRAGSRGARQRLLALIARGEPITGVFFYSEAVEAAAIEDECHAWRALARRHNVPLILCSASAARRGVVPVEGGAAPAGFQTAGIGRFADLAHDADTILVAEAP